MNQKDKKELESVRLDAIRQGILDESLTLNELETILERLRNEYGEDLERIIPNFPCE